MEPTKSRLSPGPRILKTALAAALSVLLAFAFFLPSRTASGKIFKKEAMCIVGVGWTLASLLGAVPYTMIAGAPFADAFFESASGLTTTGASVFIK